MAQTRRSSFALLAAGSMVVVGACTAEPADELPGPPSPVTHSPAGEPVPTLDTATAAAWLEIQAVFDDFMETWIGWAAQGWPGGFDDPVAADLAAFTGSVLRNEVVASLAEDAQQGRVRTGRPRWEEPMLLELAWDREVQGEVVPEATFETCLDDSGWAPVDADTGEQVSDRVARGPHWWLVRASLLEEDEWGPAGWVLTQVDQDRSRSC